MVRRSSHNTASGSTTAATIPACSGVASITIGSCSEDGTSTVWATVDPPLLSRSG